MDGNGGSLFAREEKLTASVFVVTLEDSYSKRRGINKG